MSKFVTLLQSVCGEDQTSFELCKVALLEELGFFKDGQFNLDINKAISLSAQVEKSAYAGMCSSLYQAHKKLTQSAKDKELIKKLLGKRGVRIDRSRDQDYIH